MASCTSAIFKESVFNTAEERIEEAFKVIRQHFLLCKEIYVNKDELVKQLQERNTRLTKAVELLQRESVAQKRQYANHDVADVVDDLLPYESEPNPINVAGTVDDLNVAFDNERMFNNSIDGNECIIAETEPIPRTGSITKDPNKSIISKNLHAQSKLGNHVDNNAVNNQEHQIVYHNCLNKKGTGVEKSVGNNYQKLTTHNSRKLRQTRLQFDAINNNNTNNVNELNEAETLVGPEEIGASPTIKNSNKLNHTKNKRSWMHSWNRKNTQIHFEDDTDCDEDSDFADNSPKKVVKNNNNNNIKKKQKINQEKELEVPRKEHHEDNKWIEPTTSQSIMLVSPEPPEIVFLDDSTTEDEDTTQLKTMDLLKLDGTFLERAENNCIKRAKIQNYDIVTDKDDNKWLRPLPVTIKQEPADNQHAKNSSNNSIEEGSVIKNTNSQNITNGNKRKRKEEEEDWQVLDKEDLEAICKMEEKVEEFYHRPILIKEETTSKATSNLQKQPASDIDFDMGLDSMQLTPDDFWNPFLESFKEDDPRKEVLRDPRLANKKK